MSTKFMLYLHDNISVDFSAKRAYTNDTERANKNKKLQILQGFEQTSWGWTWRVREGFLVAILLIVSAYQHV